MKRRLILSNQQLISMLAMLGYDPILVEEVHYRCGPDSTCEPIIVSSLNILLEECIFPAPSIVFITNETKYLLN